MLLDIDARIVSGVLPVVVKSTNPLQDGLRKEE